MFVVTNITPHVQSSMDWMLITAKLLTILFGPSLFLNIPSLAGRRI